MSSLDATPYVDLSPYDTDPQSLVELAINDLRSKLPTWVPRETSTETLLIEAIALEVAETIYATNRLTSSTLEGLLKLYQVVRDTGTPPTVTLQFNVATSNGYIIPAGTQVRVPLPVTGGYMTLTTIVELSIPSGSSNGTVDATGDVSTSECADYPIGYECELIESNLYVSSVVTTSLFTGGASPETDDAYFDRASSRLSLYTETLLLPTHFTAKSLEQTYIARANTIDGWDNDQLTVPGEVGGYVTVLVYGATGAVAAEDIAALQTLLDSLCAANLVVVVDNATVVPVDLDITVVPMPGYDSATVEAAVTNIIESYLSTTTWDWDTTVHINNVIGVVSGIPEVKYVSSVTPSSDIDLGIVGGCLTEVGTLNVTVV